MLGTCEAFAAENNLKFSTDPDPGKSKTKCIYMCGKMNNVQYPASLQLYGVDLPWVTSAVHLGHELHQVGTMEHDAKVKRAIFIKTGQISENIPLAPMGVLAPVSAHAGPSAQPPIVTSGNFPARVSAESISPNFPIIRSK